MSNSHAHRFAPHASRTPRRVILIQKDFEADGIWNRLPTHFDAQTYQLVTVSLAEDTGSDAADYLLSILDELCWPDTVLIAHGTDCTLAQQAANRLEGRIAGLFLVDPPRERTSVVHPRELPTLVIASLNKSVLPAAVLRHEITQTLYPGSELLLLYDNLNTSPARTLSQLQEIFHAFCTMRVSASAS